MTKLTTKECELLSLLCAHANEILERNYALKTIWVDDNYFNARSMDVYITKLRKLLKDDPGIEIINIHGKGYKLITPSGEEQTAKKVSRYFNEHILENSRQKRVLRKINKKGIAARKELAMPFLIWLNTCSEATARS